MTETKTNKRGANSDRILLEIIKQHPGLSQYELTRKLGWSSGHIDGSIRRLLISNNIFLRVIERNGRRVNLVYPEKEKPLNIIEVPSDLLGIGNPEWRDQALFYALDSSTIGVSGHEIPEWGEISCFTNNVPITKENGKLSMVIPEKFRRFYDLSRKHRVVSVNGNNILITISGDIVEEKRYP